MSTSSPARRAVLTVSDVEVRYGKVVAATGISIAVYRGEIVALLGPNGAGKTSVLKSIMGLVPPARGTVTFHDGEREHSIARKPAHELARLGIATVPAQQIVLPRMTVEENLEMGGRFLMRDGKAIQARVEELMDIFPLLRERRRQYAGLLSGGEQRQLAIARALVAKPRLMLLDEPSIGLAPITLAAIFGMLKRIKQEQQVDILMVEQNVSKALEVADRAYVMRVGAMDFFGPAAEVAASERLRDAYLGS
jgi:branched-chain amino acid transport system ATP-binding protein